eukprot:CAMPEP_0172707750 /NCGR_PEP_ID=MMETSP1074-20121228/50149_1 /TAXON_ID=2916 /ORGANISM="Ceratium fusus, Strain PA161109" /LENGTH=73 /DNA_ID=CAMNT_0013530601 /DNA_START=96 /DNA_END=317 /DNA_ORIENTATION=-
MAGSLLSASRTAAHPQRNAAAAAAAAAGSVKATGNQDSSKLFADGQPGASEGQMVSSLTGPSQMRPLTPLGVL